MSPKNPTRRRKTHPILKIATLGLAGLIAGMLSV
jgi:hypothetical protein